MAIETYVLLSAERMLAAAEWQAGLEEAGFPLRLAEGFDSEAHRGYLACYVEGREIGFEYGLQPLGESRFDRPDPLPEQLSACARFSIPAGSPLERVGVAAMAAAVLAKRSGGLLWLDGRFVETADPVAWIRERQPPSDDAEPSGSP